MSPKYRDDHPYQKGNEDSNRTFHLAGGKPIYEIGGFISKDDFEAFKDLYRKSKRKQEKNNDFPEIEHVSGHLFGLGDLMKLIHQPGCHGIRIYYGLKKEEGKDKLQPQLMIVGVYKDGADMIDHTLILDASMPCPDYCDPTQ